ncbi:MAG: hypothetical protein DYH02_17150, partial [Candidatus Omnitrophica bacterium COP1]|nr:hypothetical protein [Candidatus Omnitrophica bacterium COP1]
MSGFFTHIPVFSLLSSLLSQVGLQLPMGLATPGADVQNLPSAADFAGLIQSMLPHSPRPSEITPAPCLPGKSPLLEALQNLVPSEAGKTHSGLKVHKVSTESPIATQEISESVKPSSEVDPATEILVVFSPQVPQTPIGFQKIDSIEPERLPAAIIAARKPIVEPEHGLSLPKQGIRPVEVLLTLTGQPNLLQVSMVSLSTAIDGPLPAKGQQPLFEQGDPPDTSSASEFLNQPEDFPIFGLPVPGFPDQIEPILPGSIIANTPSAEFPVELHTAGLHTAVAPVTGLENKVFPIPEPVSLVPFSGSLRIPLEPLTSLYILPGESVQFTAQGDLDPEVLWEQFTAHPQNKGFSPSMVAVRISTDLAGMITNQISQWKPLAEPANPGQPAVQGSH